MDDGNNFLINMSQKLKPLLKWSGGKYDELPFIRPYCPDIDSVNLYIEPFVGAGAVFFDRRYYKNVIADVHDDLINFYQQIKIGNGQLIYDIIISFGITEKSYYYVRDEHTPLNEVESAARFYYLRKTCFRGMLRYNNSGKFNIPFGKYKSINIDALLNNRYQDLLIDTEILKSSFESIFERCNDKSYFMFLDPPYDSKFTDYGYCSFDRSHHLKLAEYFKSTKNRCLMVIGETDFISDLYKEYIIGKYNKKYRFKIYGGRVGNEINNNHLLLRNY